MTRAPLTRVARFVDASIPVRDVVVAQLGDGTSMRVTTDVVAQLMGRPFHSRTLVYDVDAAGNRYNARIATDADVARLFGVPRS
jgi:hypothetical protein